MRFINASEMLTDIQSGSDLYNLETGDYVFGYSGSGAIAVYNLTINYATWLARETERLGEEYWGALLGPGGRIYENGAELEWCYDHCENPCFVRVNN